MLQDWWYLQPLRSSHSLSPAPCSCTAFSSICWLPLALRPSKLERALPRTSFQQLCQLQKHCLSEQALDAELNILQNESGAGDGLCWEASASLPPGRRTTSKCGYRLSLLGEAWTRLKGKCVLSFLAKRGVGFGLEGQTKANFRSCVVPTANCFCY